MTTDIKSHAMEHQDVTEPHKLRRMIVAHDGSAASEKALKDAIALCKRFEAEVVIAHILPAEELSADERDVSRKERVDAYEDVTQLAERLTTAGVKSRGVVRTGAVGDALFNLCSEESTDLLLLGAYGRGTQQRLTLGSTAEQLLRAVTCPVLTYGPNALSSVFYGHHSGPALLPISLPMPHQKMAEAVALAKLFGVSLEVFHAVDGVSIRDTRWFEAQCRDLAGLLRVNGVRTEWSYMYGPADSTICSKALALDSPFILMPLKWRKGLSAVTSDNVAAHVIRRATVPVLSYRCD